MKVIKYLFLIFFVLNFNTLNAEDRDKQLEVLFDELKSNNNNFVNEIEQKIWKIWSTHPKDQFLTLKLAEGSKLVVNNELSKAIVIFTEVINKDPSWAEAWNKRATVLYMIGNYQESQNDINKVLNL